MCLCYSEYKCIIIVACFYYPWADGPVLVHVPTVGVGEFTYDNIILDRIRFVFSYWYSHIPKETRRIFPKQKLKYILDLHKLKNASF